MGRVENDKFAKRVYVRECVGNLQKRWLDTMKGCLRKRGLDVRQAVRMGQDRCEWWGIVRVSVWGEARGMKSRP